MGWLVDLQRHPRGPRHVSSMSILGGSGCTRAHEYMQVKLVQGCYYRAAMGHFLSSRYHRQVSFIAPSGYSGLVFGALGSLGGHGALRRPQHVRSDTQDAPGGPLDLCPGADEALKIAFSTTGHPMCWSLPHPCSTSIDAAGSTRNH